MGTQEKNRWMNWAESLRQEMMVGMCRKITKQTLDIRQETGTEKSEQVTSSVRFWRDCQNGKGPHGCLIAAGFEIEFAADKSKPVSEVTLTLNKTWQDILQKKMDRMSPSKPPVA